MKARFRALSWLPLTFALGAACGGNTERKSGDPEAGTVGSGGVSGAAGAAVRGGGAGQGGAAGSSGMGGDGPSRGGTMGNSGSGNAGGDAGSGNAGGNGGSAGSIAGRGGSAGTFDAGIVDLCSLPAEIGPCLAAMPRFYYDPVTARCREFTYGGCGGNSNNFMTHADCQAKCGHRVNGCQMCGTDSCGEHKDCSACPVNGEVSGQACGTPGLQCSYGGCGGPICTCRDSSDGLTWQCVVLPC